MAFEDIGIDLGTATVQVCQSERGLILEEPSVVAVNTKTDTVLAVGDEAYKMIGRTPSYIQAVHPLEDGVISNYEMTERMIQYFLKSAVRIQCSSPESYSVCLPVLPRWKQELRWMRLFPRVQERYT